MISHDARRVIRTPVYDAALAERMAHRRVRIWFWSGLVALAAIIWVVAIWGITTG